MLLSNYLQQKGIPLNPCFTLQEALAISADGTTIAGYGINGQTLNTEAFITHIPTCFGFCRDRCCESHPGCYEAQSCWQDCSVPPTPTPQPTAYPSNEILTETQASWMDAQLQHTPGLEILCITPPVYATATAEPLE